MRETEQIYIERRIGLWGKYSVQLNISIRRCSWKNLTVS